ncbi:MAG: DUF6527 family protein [Janthinobacterium lividum]
MARVSRISWWQRLPFWGWRIVTNVESADDIPSEIPRNGAVLVGPRIKPKWIAFDCPCHSGHRIMLNTDKSRLPYWKVSTSGALTIAPSIDYSNGEKRCHYFIRKGHVQWVPERHAP